MRTGRLERRAGGVFRPVPRKVDPKKIAKAEEQQPQDPIFELCGDVLLAAQNVSTLREMAVVVTAFSASSGRVLWKRKVPYPWKEGFALWSEGPLAFLGDSSDGPMFVFPARTGKMAKIEFPKGETYQFAGSDGSRLAFYHIRPGELYLVGYDASGKVLWRKGLPDCYPSKAYLQPFVNGSVLPCKAKTGVQDHMDRLMKIDFADGKVLWDVEAHRRPGDKILDPKRPDLISLRKGKDGASYFRNRFEFVRVEPEGRKAWGYPLEDKEIYVLVGDEHFRSDNVMAGDEPYEKVVSLDPRTGKPRWEYSEPDGLPARGMVRDGLFLMWGVTEVRVLGVGDGKLVFKHKTRERIEGLSLQPGILYVDTAGVRRAYRLSDGKILLHDKSEDEAVLNNWLALGTVRGLYLYQEEDRRVSLVEPVTGDRQIPLPKEGLRRVRLFTPPTVEVDSVRFVDDSAIEFTTLDDERAWRVTLAGGAPQAVGKRPESIPRLARGGALAFLGDPVKVTERVALRARMGGKERVVAERPVGDFAWSRSGRLLAYAERREATRKNSNLKVIDLALRVYDAARGESRDVLVMRGADEMTRLASASFGPGDAVITFALENLYGNHVVATLPVGGRAMGEMKLDDAGGSVSIRIPGNRPPTHKLGVDTGDLFGEVAWSADARHLAVLHGQRLQIYSASGREVFARPESSVSLLRWTPRGGTLYYVKDGNLWRWRQGKTEQVSFFLAKREPRVEEEVKAGNWPRFSSLDFSPNGKHLAFGLRFPDDGKMRVAVLDVE